MRRGRSEETEGVHAGEDDDPDAPTEVDREEWESNDPTGVYRDADVDSGGDDDGDCDGVVVDVGSESSEGSGVLVPESPTACASLAV